jgi:hypothetical protein
MNLGFSGPQESSSMNLRNTRVATILALNVCAMLTAMAHAAEPAKQTQFSTNGPVEVPGMMLDTGQYLFKLIEPEAQRNVLQVFETVQLWTGDDTRLLSTMLTMPNYDLPSTDKTVFTFFERGSQQPKALRIWFAPGRRYGQELVYPKAQAAELAKTVGRGVLSLPAELPGDIGQLARMVAEPNGPAAKAPVASPVSGPSAAAPVNEIPAASTSAPVAPPMQTRSPEASRAPRDVSITANSARRGATSGSASSSSTSSAAPVQSRTRAREPKMIASAIPKAASLPKTASYLALVAFMGLLGIAGGTVLHILALQLEHR